MNIQYPETAQIKELIDAARHILIMQADNPDADSLGSSLALEDIFENMDKKVSMYCAVDMPSYLKYLPGWDRVNFELPSDFDAVVIVDASTMTLFEKLSTSGKQGWVASKPVIVLDHHTMVQNDIPFVKTIINDPDRSSASEVVFHIAKQAGWPLSVEAQTFIMTAILGDTQGLSNSLATVTTYEVMAELIGNGVDRPKLEEQRREYTKMPQSIFRYKADLIKRTELHNDGKIGVVEIPQEEINTHSPLYNPGPLIQTDMLQVEGLQVGIVFKKYSDGRITAAIRCNPGFTIAADLATHFGGGGHGYASGFKITNGKPFHEVKSECISVASELLERLQRDTKHEAV